MLQSIYPGMGVLQFVSVDLRRGLSGSSGVTATKGLVLSLRLQAFAVGNPASRDALYPPSGLSLPAVICPLIWFQLGSFEAELNSWAELSQLCPCSNLKANLPVEVVRGGGRDFADGPWWGE